jgi:hypothetical protein
MPDLLMILVGAVTALAVLRLVRRSGVLAADACRPDVAALASRWADSARTIARSRIGGSRVGGSWALRSTRQRRRWPARSNQDPHTDPTWVKVAGPQAWRERKDVGCQQCSPSWELGMKTCVRCGRRLADVFTAGRQWISR